MIEQKFSYMIDEKSTRKESNNVTDVTFLQILVEPIVIVCFQNRYPLPFSCEERLQLEDISRRRFGGTKPIFL